MGLTEEIRNMETVHLREKVARMEKLLKKRDLLFARHVLKQKKPTSHEDIWEEQGAAPKDDKTKP